MGQHQERRLERILRVLRIAEHPAADAQDHRPVPVHQLFEGGLGTVATTPRDECVEELTVRPSADRPEAE